MKILLEIVFGWVFVSICFHVLYLLWKDSVFNDGTKARLELQEACRQWMEKHSEGEDLNGHESR